MSLCASCGVPLAGDESLCLHHHSGAYSDGWAMANRIVCDLVHRRIVPSRLSAADRDDDFLRRADQHGVVLVEAELVVS